MASSKEKHYWSQLRSALTGGQWLAELPAKTPQGTQISWSELFRKFNKHCRGFNDISELASQNYSLALLLSSSSLNEDEDYADVRDFSVELGRESVLPLERVEEAVVAYETLKTMQTPNSDSVNFALAYYAYALGRPSDCLSHLAQVPDLSQIQSFVPTMGTTRSNTSNLLSVPAGGMPSASSSVTGGFSFYADSPVAEVKDGRGWALTETFRSLCLQGMCHERLYPEDPSKALRAYRIALPAFKILQSPEFASLISPPGRLASGKLDFSSFVQLRELWRWVERLLWRAICLSSRISNVHTSQDDSAEEDGLWMWLEKYTICSASWPPTFRTEHRSTISSIYLRALVLRHGVPREPTHTLIPEKAPIWMQTARSVVQDYRAILNVSTKFPRAGERNVKVEEFVDLCVSVWEASGAIGEHASWVLEVLWWATRLTFNSSRVLRHMARILYLSGDIPLAKRSLRLYVQVVSKAWQASKQGAGESVNPNDNDTLADTDHEGYLEDTDTDINWVETLVFGARMLCRTASSKPGLHDIDDVKEAQSILGKAKERMKFAETAGLETETVCQRLRAEVALAEGIADGVLAVKAQDQLARPGLLQSAHKHLLDSISIHPIPAAHFHLALSYARAGAHHDLDQAIQHAGLAVEESPRDIRHWHLLGLLLTAAEKWEEADTILDHGADIDSLSAEVPTGETRAGSPIAVATFEQVDESGSTNATTVTPNGKDNTVPLRTRRQSRNLALDGASMAVAVARTLTSETITPVRIERVGLLNANVLAPDAAFVPPSSYLLRSILDPIPPSKRELFEWGLQLRMSQMTMMEVQQGPEGAEQGWLEVFGWVAEKRGLVPSTASTDEGTYPYSPTFSTNITDPDLAAHPLRPSVDLRRSLDFDSRHMSQISVSALNATTVQSRNGHNFSATQASSSISNGEDAGPPPIMILPASPDNNSAIQDETDPFPDNIERSHSFSVTEKKSGLGVLGLRRSSSLEQHEKDKEKGGDTSKSKKVQQMLKNSVQQGQMRITAVGRKIGHEITKNGHLGSLRKSTSTPDFHAALQQTSYQASSIHSRRRVSSIIRSEDRTPTESPTPPAPAPSPGPQSGQAPTVLSARSLRENRLLSDLWLMSAATFRRLSKVDQAKGSIQEGEVKDENNPNVWVQLALCYSASNHTQHAISTLQKALFIDPDDVSATVHLARLYLTPPSEGANSEDSSQLTRSNIDLACGLLTHLSKGRGWDVPEVWYYLATAYRLQGRADKESEALERALELSEGRGVRDLTAAIGLCI